MVLQPLLQLQDVTQREIAVSLQTAAEQEGSNLPLSHHLMQIIHTVDIPGWDRIEMMPA